MFTTTPGKDASRHRAIFNSATDFAIIATDRDGLVTDWNIGAETVFGWSAREMAGEVVDRIFVPDDRVEGRPAIEMLLALENGVAVDERWHLKKDGSVFWASGQMTPLRDIDGSHIGYLKIARDRTAERQADAWMNEDRERLRLMFEQAPGFVALLSTRDHVFDLVNPAYLQLVGHRDVLGKTVRQALPEIEGQGFFEILDRVFSSGEAFRGFAMEILVQRTPDTSPELRYVDLVYQPVRGVGGAIEGIFAQGTDVTERVRAEAKVKARDAQFEVLAEAMPNHVWTSDTEGHLVWFNKQTYDYSAMERGSLDGAGWASIVHPDDIETAGSRWAQSLASGNVYETEFRLRRYDGLYRWHLGRALPIRDDAGAIIRWIGTNTDIEDQKAAAHALGHLNETLEARVEERSRKLHETEEALRQSQKMEAVGQLTGGLAHDFNNLLTGMMGNLELLQARMAQGRLQDIDRFVQAAQGAGRRAASLTQRLLAFSRRQTLDPRPSDVNRLISGLEDLLKRTVGPANIIEIIGAAGLWTANIDAGQLENALLNLCINARDASPDGGKITIETANKWLDERGARERDLNPGQYLSVCVTDTGIGMSAETVSRAFEPFFTTKPIGQGTGLGLSMIYGFARQSGGQVRIYSEVGIGTTVCVYLPRHLGEAEAPEIEPSIKNIQGSPGQTVLVIDDEATIRHLIDEVLDEIGYTVIGAADGAAGLKVLQSRARIDLLITDVGLPNGMNGRQVADAARVIRPSLKILFITGYAENAAVGNGYLEPGMELLTKPFTMEALAAKVSGITKAPG